MAHTHKLTSEGLVELTTEEIAEANARDKAWNDAKPTRQLNKIKKLRLQKLIETDYLAMSDNVLSDDMKNFRKKMRDIPQDFSTEEQYDLLLARDEQGNLTHTIWSKP